MNPVSFGAPAGVRRCRLCDKRVKGERKSRHHVVPRSIERFSGEHNLTIMTCRSCHDRLHNRGKTGEKARKLLRSRLTYLEELWVIDHMGREWLDATYPPSQVLQMEAA